MRKSILRLATVVLTGICLAQTGSGCGHEHLKEDLNKLTEARPFSVVNVLVKPQVRKALDLDSRESEKIDQLVKDRTDQWTNDWAEDVAAVKARFPVNKLIEERLEVEEQREKETLEKLGAMLSQEQRRELSHQIIKSGSFQAICHPWANEVLKLTKDQQRDLLRMSSDLRTLRKNVYARQKYREAVESEDKERIREINQLVERLSFKTSARLFEILTPEQTETMYRLSGLLREDETVEMYIDRQREPFRTYAREALESRED